MRSNDEPPPFNEESGVDGLVTELRRLGLSLAADEIDLAIFEGREERQSREAINGRVVRPELKIRFPLSKDQQLELALRVVRAYTVGLYQVWEQASRMMKGATEDLRFKVLAIDPATDEEVNLHPEEIRLSINRLDAELPKRARPEAKFWKDEEV